MFTYEEVVAVDIYRAIKMKCEEKDKEIDIFSIAKVPNNPILADYDWVFEHAEQLFCHCRINYQQYQGVEQYLTLFKSLINKYSLEEDYHEHYEYFDKWFSPFLLKWSRFAQELVLFMGYSFDERLDKLLEKKEIMDYFLNYPKVFTHSVIRGFGSEGLPVFLNYNYYASCYTDDYRELISLIRENPKIVVPDNIMLNKKVIEDMSRTYHIYDFYFNLYFVREQVCDLSYLEEHADFCDKEVSNIKNGMLPKYYERYNETNNSISINNLVGFNNNERRVLTRIFELKGTNILPKKVVFRELSKYMLVGMYISRNFQTDPYNLLIDIKTLNNFAKENNIILEGQFIYDFLTSFENYSTEEILEFYNNSKKLPLMHILYDDWNNQKYNFVDELNNNMLNLDCLEVFAEIDGVKCFDISDIENSIVVHNTSVSINDTRGVREMIDRIKNGDKYCLSLSIQDKEHRIFYIAENSQRKSNVKFVFGKLNKKRVGTVYHCDAYTTGASSVESENYNYIRRLYTLISLMSQTCSYNELVYVMNGEPFLPIGIICENVITKEELLIAKELNIPVLYRKIQKHKRSPYVQKLIKRKYSNTIDKPIVWD